MKNNEQTIEELISELKKGISSFQANLSKLEKMFKESQKELEVPSVEEARLKTLEKIESTIPVVDELSLKAEEPIVENTEENISEENEESYEFKIPSIEESTLEKEESISDDMETNVKEELTLETHSEKVAEEIPAQSEENEESYELEMPEVEETVLKSSEESIPFENKDNSLEEVKGFSTLDLSILSHVKEYFKEHWPESVENAKVKESIQEKSPVLEPIVSGESKIEEESYDLKMPEIENPVLETHEEPKLYTPKSFAEETPLNPGNEIEEKKEEESISDFPNTEMNFDFEEMFEKMKNEGKGNAR